VVAGDCSDEDPATKVLLTGIMSLYHGMFVKHEARKNTLAADSHDSLLRAPDDDRSCTRLCMHAFVTGELDLPELDLANPSNHKKCMGTFVMSGVCKKINHPRKMDSLPGYLARAVESCSTSLMKGILSSIGLAGNYLSLRRT
jgi:hypothetical protein